MQPHRFSNLLVLFLSSWPQGSTKNPVDGGGEQVRRLERYVRMACQRNPLIRVQAARRLAGTGEAGWRAVEAFVRSQGMGSLSAELVLALGSMGSLEALRWLRKVHGRKDFPWPPQALRALAMGEGPVRREDKLMFQRGLKDSSASIRLAALFGVLRTGGRESIPLLRRSLGDPSPLVRIGAAKLLLEEKDPLGLPVLIESLELRDFVLDIDLAAAPRMEAGRVLRRYFRDPRKGSLPRDPRAFAAFAGEKARVLLGRDYRLPALARASAPGPRFVFLAERRSCRVGDFIVRIAENGTVWRGEAPPRRIPGLDGHELLRLFRKTPTSGLGKPARIRCDYLRVAWGEGKRLRRAPKDFPPSWTPFLRLLKSWEEASRRK